MLGFNLPGDLGLPPAILYWLVTRQKTTKGVINQDRPAGRTWTELLCFSRTWRFKSRLLPPPSPRPPPTLCRRNSPDCLSPFGMSSRQREEAFCLMLVALLWSPWIRSGHTSLWEPGFCRFKRSCWVIVPLRCITRKGMCQQWDPQTAKASLKRSQRPRQMSGLQLEFFPSSPSVHCSFN